MNINCVICSDQFEPHSIVYITQCGHMFHYDCLLHWIERSKSCPQCRDKCTEKSIHRVYFNLSNTDNISEDAGLLRNKVDSLQFQITLKEKDIKIFSEKYSKMKNRNIALREEIQQLERDKKVSESAIHALKDQISYFKSKSKDLDKLSEEVGRLRNKVKDNDKVQLAMHGTRAEVNDMLRNENNVESLAILAATLKKALLDAERKARDTGHKLKLSMNDVTRYRHDAHTFECQYNEIKKEYEHLRANSNQEKQYLKQKILALDKQRKTKAESSPENINASIVRIVDESPINFKRRPITSSPIEIDLTDTSLNMSEKVKKIVDSDSPYLPVKSSSVGIDNLLNTKYTTKPSTSKKYTIFKSAPTKLENIQITKTTNKELAYNGLGGTSKDDVYPSPKTAQTSLKRHKSFPSVSSNKFRRLAPLLSKHSAETDVSHKDKM